MCPRPGAFCPAAGTACPCRHHAGCGALGLRARQARWESPGQRPTNVLERWPIKTRVDSGWGATWGCPIRPRRRAGPHGWLSVSLRITTSSPLGLSTPTPRVLPGGRLGEVWRHSGAGARTKPRGQGSGLPLGWWAQARLVERGLWVCGIEGSCSPALGGSLSISWQGRLTTSIRCLGPLVPGLGWGWIPAPRGVSA